MCWSLGFPGVSLGYLGVWRGIREVSPEVWFEVYTPIYVAYRRTYCVESERPALRRKFVLDRSSVSVGLEEYQLGATDTRPIRSRPARRIPRRRVLSSFLASFRRARGVTSQKP